LRCAKDRPQSTKASRFVIRERSEVAMSGYADAGLTGSVPRDLGPVCAIERQCGGPASQSRPHPGVRPGLWRGQCHLWGREGSLRQPSSIGPESSAAPVELEDRSAGALPVESAGRASSAAPVKPLVVLR
jgi:hypothetical protein